MFRSYKLAMVLMFFVAGCNAGNPLDTSSDPEKAKALVSQSRAALAELYDQTSGAEEIAKEAKGVLVFPNVVKAGLGIGGETGNGVLFVNDDAIDFYNRTGASYGFQAGAEKRSEVVMFMSSDAISKLQNRAGFEFGADAAATVLDAGAAARIDTTNIDAEVLAFIFGQSGLMLDASLAGSKVTKIDFDL